METKTQDLGDEFLRQARAREYLGKYRRQTSDVRLLVALPAARSAHVPQIRFRAYVNVAMNRGAGSEKERVQAAFLVFDCFIERATMLVFDVEPGTCSEEGFHNPPRLLAVVGPLGFCFCGRGLRLGLA